MKKERIATYLKQVQAVIAKLDSGLIYELATLLHDCQKRQGTVFAFGNGGSGATASHFVGDFLKGVRFPNQNRLKAICLNDNIPGMMAVANDMSYEDIFVESLRNFAQKDDLVIGFSGSGNSENILRALRYANHIQAHSVAICGFDGGKAKSIAKTAIHVPINDMEIAEDSHLVLVHAMKKIFM